MGKHIEKTGGIFPELFRHILFAWIFAAAVAWLLLPEEGQKLSGLSSLTETRFVCVLVMTCAGAAILWCLSLGINMRCAERLGFIAVFFLFAASAVSQNFSWAFFTVCAVVEIGWIVFGLRGWDGSPEASVPPQKSGKIWLWLTVVLSAAFFLFVCAWTIGRVYSFSSPSYDFGIFSQMFYHMKKYGLPMTTLERDGLLSHFAVHVSPIYYLLLPFYCLAPTPATLQLLQAAVITSSVIPLWKIGKCHGLSGLQRMLVCAVLLLYPAFSGGTSYDIHENCFLTPLILWLFYGIDRRNSFITALAAVLTLAVKEDAAVYVAVIAVYVIVKALLEGNHSRDLILGGTLLAFSLVWFLTVTTYLSTCGEGVMTYRYRNFIYDGSSSLLTVIKAVIMNPMKAVYECVDQEKLAYISLTLFPLLGLPILTRRYQRYLLLIPYILVNLMSDYRYQHDVFFQYSFGSTAFLMYLIVVNLSDIKMSWRRVLLLAVAVAACGVCFGRVVYPAAVQYPQKAVQYYPYYQNLRDTLSQIPEDASVAAHTFYTTALSARDELYDVKYASIEHILGSDYVVLKKTYAKEFERFADPDEDNGYENLVQLLWDNGFITLTDNQRDLIILCKPSVQ